MNVDWNNTEAREKYLKKTKEAFFYSEQSNMVHDKDCPYVRAIRKNHLRISNVYPSDKCRLCHECGRRVMIRAGAQDHVKCMERYMNLFQGVSDACLYNLFILKQAYCSWTNNGLYFICGEDHWRIVKKHGKINLLHNNYFTSFGGERIFVEGWHKEKANTVNQALIKIYTYDYRLHRKWREQRMLRNGVAIMDGVALAQ